MEWEIEAQQAPPEEPAALPKKRLRPAMIARYVVEAVIFGFLAGAIGYGFHSATAVDLTVSYIVGIIFVAMLYFVYLYRIVGV